MMNCLRLNKLGRRCGGRLELYYENGDSLKVYECQNPECGLLWKYEGGGFFSTSIPDISYFDKLKYDISRWWEREAGEPFTDVLRDIWSGFVDMLPSLPSGGTREFSMGTSGSGFENAKPRKITIKSEENRVENEKPTFSEAYRKWGGANHG